MTFERAISVESKRKRSNCKRWRLKAQMDNKRWKEMALEQYKWR